MLSPEFYFVGTLAIGAVVAYLALRQQTGAEVVDDLASLSRKIKQQESQIHFLLERLTELQNEVGRLRAISDMRENENKILTVQIEQYRRKFEALGLADK